MSEIKIHFIEARNLGPIHGHVEADFSQSPILMVKGLNGAGKSFFGETLFDLLRNKFPGQPLSDGEQSGYFRAVLSDGHEILYKFDGDGQKLEFFLPGKKSMTQAQRKALISDLLGDKQTGFDLNKYLIETAPKKRSAMLAQLVGLDFTAINQEIAKQVELREIKGRDYRAAKARAEFSKPLTEIKADAEAEVPTTDAIAGEIQRMTEHNQRIQNHGDMIAEKERKLNVYINGRADLEKQVNDNLLEIERLKAKNEELQDRIVAANRVIEDQRNAIDAEQKPSAPFTDEQIQSEKSKLNQIAEIQTSKIQAQEMLRKIDEAEAMKSEYEAQDSEVKKAEAKKAEMIANCRVIEGLTFDMEGNAIYNGRPIEDASTGEQVMFAVNVKKRESGDLKFMHVDCHALDGANIKRLAEKFTSEGWTVLLEVPEQDPEAERGLKISIVKA